MYIVCKLKSPKRHTYIHSSKLLNIFSASKSKKKNKKSTVFDGEKKAVGKYKKRKVKKTKINKQITASICTSLHTYIYI